ncbi:TOM1-like protein 1 [Arachis hypogaea]|uniref:TOM1-like protein 1 n=1 Tax=Arachis hypogaea TaxID=3818 RepID=UPI000DED2FE4|nr:TOM1-like protein 1 [Arachis hypogaea]
MSENLMEKVNALGERLKIGGVEVGRKMSAGMSSMSFKVKEFFHGQNHADRLVEEATSESLDEPDWSMNLQIYDLINDHESINTGEVVRAIKRRIMMRNNPRIQYLALVLLEALLKNCDNKGFMEVASERVLDEMVKLIDDPLTVSSNRNKALIDHMRLGESTTQLRYLPVFEETYKSLKSRGVGFPVRDNESLAPIFTPPPRRSSSAADSDDIILPHPIRYDIPMRSFTSQPTTKEAFHVARNTIELLYTILSSSPHQQLLRDELTTSLVQQCQRSRCDVQRIAETSGDNEALLFEALNVNDEIQKVLTKYQEFNKPTAPPALPTFTPLQPVEAEESPGRNTTEDDDDDDALIRKPSDSRVGLSHDDMMHDLDEMIFGKKGVGDDPTNHHQSSKHDLISF